MAGYDDDEQRAAYDRAIEFARDNAAFADIIQHYDDTARPDHDDIDYDPAGLDDLDGAEYDDNGDPVFLIGAVGTIIIDISGVINDLCDAIDEFGSFEDIPDDYEFGPPETGGYNPSSCDRDSYRIFRQWCERFKRPRIDDNDAGPDTPD
jgi:hypothetical protein